MATAKRRLEDLLANPREDLDVEIKGWLDLKDAQHKATLAKALLALANTGGGFIIIGLSESAGSFVDGHDRPKDLSGYTNDVVNAIVARYAEPEFHCDCQIAVHQGKEYPVIAVPGDHLTPVRCKRPDSSGRVLRQHSYYIRKPGPKSEEARSAQEWDALIRRCVLSNRTTLVDQVRLILSKGSTKEEPTRLEALRQWMDQLHELRREAVKKLPGDAGATLRHGHFTVAYDLHYPDFEPGQADDSLLAALRQATVRYTGWPVFWVPTKQDIAPYPRDGAIECFIGGADGALRDPAHCDFWRVEPSGRLGLIRGLEEDGDPDQAGKRFDPSIPIWRLGETLMHASEMATALGVPEAEVTFGVRYGGLSGRHLCSLDRLREILGSYRCRQNIYNAGLEVKANEIPGGLPELVSQLAKPLVALFEFFELSDGVVRSELAKMQQR